MKRQTTRYNCGPAAVQNALRFYGKRFGQSRLAAAAGTTPEGTDEVGIMAALRYVGVRYYEQRQHEEGTAWCSLQQYPSICCIDRWRHWVTVFPVSLRTGRVLYFDPAKEEHLMSELNTMSVSRTKFMQRWEAARRVRGPEGERFYGIRVLG